MKGKGEIKNNRLTYKGKLVISVIPVTIPKGFPEPPPEVLESLHSDGEREITHCARCSCSIWKIKDAPFDVESMIRVCIPCTVSIFNESGGNILNSYTKPLSELYN